MSAAAPPGQGKQPTKPFIKNTRQRVQKLPSVAIAAGQTVAPQISPVGFAARIYAAVAATVTNTAGAPAAVTNTAAGTGVWNLLKRISGITNLGTANIFDLSGYGAHLVTRMVNRDVVIENALSGVSGADPLYNNPAAGAGFTSGATQNFNFVLVLPLSLNDGDQFNIGLINLQADEVRFNLNLTFGQPSDFLAGTDVAAGKITLGGTVNLYYEYYEVPPASVIDDVILPPRVMHRLVEDTLPILSTGDTTYLFPKQGTLLQALHTVRLNGAISTNATDVISRRLILNKTDTPYNFDYIFDRIQNRLRYGAQELNPGTFVWDFFNASELVTRGGLRDAFDTQKLQNLESVITIAQGATLGANNNFVDTIRRILQKY